MAAVREQAWQTLIERLGHAEAAEQVITELAKEVAGGGLAVSQAADHVVDALLRAAATHPHRSGPNMMWYSSSPPKVACLRPAGNSFM